MPTSSAKGALTARGHFAVVISAEEGREPAKAIAAVQALAQRYDQGPAEAEPTIMVRNIKLFLDGVITAPAFTGAMVAPYFENAGHGAGAKVGAGQELRACGVFPARAPERAGAARRPRGT